MQRDREERDGRDREDSTPTELDAASVLGEWMLLSQSRGSNARSGWQTQKGHGDG